MSYELLHFLKRKKRGRPGYMSIKLDVSKAYDIMEYNYLENVMVSMGFKKNMIALIMKCVLNFLLSFS